MSTRAESRLYHGLLKSKLEEIFLDILQSNLPERILEFAENNPLIKDEKQMTMAPLYSPTCDVAVGPFSFREGSINEVYHSLANLDEVKSFIANLQENSLGTGYNEVLLDLNLNPRCFIAIEVEKATAHDIKHLLGSVINCSLMAKIGIVVVFDDYLEYAGRLLQYLAFVKRVKKASKDLFRNVFVISKSCMDMLLGISQ